MAATHSSLVHSTLVAFLLGFAACTGAESGSTGGESGATDGTGEPAAGVVDDGNSAAETGSRETGPLAPPDARVGELGETLEFGSGHRATVHRVELGVTGEHVMMGQPDTTRMAVIDAELCAGSEALDLRLTSAGNFGLYQPRGATSQTLQGVGGRNQTWDGEQTFARPSLAEPLGPGQCIRGPVLVPADSDGGFTSAVFNSAMHSGAPEEQRVTLAWRLR